MIATWKQHIPFCAGNSSFLKFSDNFCEPQLNRIGFEMRIGFDMQALQSVNSIGGIGKYSYNFLKYLFELYSGNKYFLFYNGLYRERGTKLNLNQYKNVHTHTINYLPGNDLNSLNRLIQYIHYRSKSLDLLHILSPFEDQYHTVILNRMLPVKTVITIYDFIPFIFKNLYLNTTVSQRRYHQRLKIFKSADLILSISECTRKDAINLFNVAPDKIVNIGLAVSDKFYRIGNLASDLVSSIRKKYGIDGSFVLTVSNLDHRKNLVGLLRAFSRLPQSLLREFSLVVVTNSGAEYIRANNEINDLIDKNKNLKFKFLYFIPDEDLNVLYNVCQLFVYASLYEGGGLPVLEAMKCGAPVLASNTSSIPELVGRTDTLFDPNDLDDIAALMTKILMDSDYRLEVAQYGLQHSKNFSWETVVKRAMGAYEYILR